MDKKLIAILLLGVFMRLLFFNFTADDAYISFRYARNLVEGKGFVYNPGENVLGITNPLYALLISAGMLMGFEPVLFSKLIGIASFFGISLLGWKFLKGKYDRLTAYAFVLMLAVDHYSSKWFMSGMETPLFAFVVFLACLMFMKEREMLAGLLAGISIFIRPEGGFLLPVFLLLSKDRKKIVPGILVALSFFAILQLIYGLPVPHPIYAKLSVREGGLGDFLQSGYPLLNVFLKEPFPVMLLFFSPASMTSFVLFPLLVFVAYFLINAPVFFWYYAPYYPLVFFVASIGLLNVLNNFKGDFSKLFAAVFLTFLVIHQVGFAARETYLQQDEIQNNIIYKDFAMNVSEGDKIVIADIGLVGYYSNQYIFDISGLVSPRALECLVQNKLKECILQLKPDYLVVMKGTFQEDLPEEVGCTEVVTESNLHIFYGC